MSQSWESYVDAQEMAEWGAHLNGMINDLAYVMDINQYAGLANPLRRILEQDYEKMGGHIDFNGSAEQLKDHLLHVHNFQMNLDNASYEQLGHMHDKAHPEWSEAE